MLSYFTHKRTCSRKRRSRAAAIAALPAAYHTPLTSSELTILNTPVSITASSVRSGTLPPSAILIAYGKRALQAHARTNCLTEILLPTAESWLATPGELNLNFGPLAGIPVSLKDTVNIAGYDSSIGYSGFCDHPATSDAPIIQILKDAGAVPFVKTNVPTTLLSFESTNDVFGRTDNPHVSGFSPGGSTGGEAALLAMGGSRIGVGTDVAGSVRVPAAWSGIYALRCSTGRFPRSGCRTSMAGQEGVPAVYSPMAKTMEDLSYFLRTVVAMRPWEYDHTVHPLPWREVTLGKRVRWGVLRDDGVVPPTPAIERALDTVIDVLRNRGDEVVELRVGGTPSCYRSLRLATRLLNSDAGAVYTRHFSSWFEHNDPGVRILSRLFALPRWLKRLYASFLRLRGDTITAGLVDDLHPRPVESQWDLVTEREAVRAEWFRYLKAIEVDFVLTPVNALPAVPAGGMRETIASCGYTFLWNLLDYPCGVVPVGRVDAVLDAAVNLGRGRYKVGGAAAEGGGVLLEERKEVVVRLGNLVARKAWGVYDAVRMQGLPTAVQVVGVKRLEEEMVVAGMERVVDALEKGGLGWRGLELDVD